MVCASRSILEMLGGQGLNMAVIILLFLLGQLVDGWRGIGNDIKQIGGSIAASYIPRKGFGKGRIANPGRTVRKQGRGTECGIRRDINSA